MQPSLLVSLLGGVAAALGAGATMAFFRWTLAVRTAPERLLEWALLFISPDQFEAALLQFGFEAKRYALYASIGIMILVLSALGALALHRCWSTARLLALALGLWLFTMLVIMPLTAAGVFAGEIIDGTGAAIAGYFTVALAYAAILAVVLAANEARETCTGGVRPAVGPSKARRAALILTSGALMSLIGAFVLVRSRLRRDGPTRISVLDPQEPVPSGGIEPPNPHPNLVPTLDADVRVASLDAAVPPTATTGPAAVVAERQTASSSAPSPHFPAPPPSRQLPRDDDGSVSPSGRRAGELAELITPSNSFYIVTKNASGDPVLRATDWRVRVDGDVQRSIEIDYASLRNLSSVEVVKTLECVSNFVDKCELAPFGCDLISTARWRGVPLRDVLQLSGGLQPGVVSLSTISADEFTTSLPIEVALDPATLLVYEMNGDVLPREHGYPARVLVPGRYGMKSAKWVIALRPLRRQFTDWYGQRQWTKDGIVKTMTRIDIPARDATLPHGEHRIAGIAYGGDRGVAYVDFSADDGMTWHRAELLEPAPAQDAWVRWQGNFTLSPGVTLTLVSRATDGNGEVQIEDFKLPHPDGSSGWHHVTVTASG